MRRILVVGAVLFTACGGDDGTGPGPDYANVAGTFRGAVASGRMEGTLKLVIGQRHGELEGSWATSVKDGIGWLQSVGTLTGTISKGASPALSFRLEDQDCPSVTNNWTGTLDTTMNWTGTYDTTSKAISITGDFRINSGLPWCFAEGEYPSLTVVLSR